MPAEWDYEAKAAEYREHAVKCRAIAAKTTDEAERQTLLTMAESWLRLADRMKDLAER